MNPRSLWLGGRLVPAVSDDRIPVISPVSEAVIGSVVDASAADIDVAVRAARAALPGWRATPAAQRAEVLERIADSFAKRAGDIAAVIAQENASPAWWSQRENIEKPEGMYRGAAAAARALVEEELVEVAGHRAVVRREPLGVVAAIVPWNAPMILLALKVASALAAGCTVVAKPSPETSLDTYLLAEVFEAAGVPAGVVNIVTGGARTGADLVAHPGVDKVSFTGSTAAGRAIASVCGQQLKPVTAELGGKSASLLLEDADLDVFGAAIQYEGIPFNGQVCFSSTRVLAPRSRYEEVVERAVETMRGLPFGDPADPSVVLGPLVSERQRDRVEGYLRAGASEGARVLVGGGRAAGFDRGWYVEPTVFADVTPAMTIFQEEIFGPVLTVTPYDDEDDAVALHDATAFGLHGNVFSTDVERATAVARRLQTGTVLVNALDVGPISASAYKDSGVGAAGVGLLTDYLLTKRISQP
jgi:acyl-CoA reductase-like NAD-dependent aldehyde dehydrogenase